MATIGGYSPIAIKLNENLGGATKKFEANANRFDSLVGTYYKTNNITNFKFNKKQFMFNNYKTVDLVYSSYTKSSNKMINMLLLFNENNIIKRKMEIVTSIDNLNNIRVNVSCINSYYLIHVTTLSSHYLYLYDYDLNNLFNITKFKRNNDDLSLDAEISLCNNSSTADDCCNFVLRQDLYSSFATNNKLQVKFSIDGYINLNSSNGYDLIISDKFITLMKGTEIFHIYGLNINYKENILSANLSTTMGSEYTSYFKNNDNFTGYKLIAVTKDSKGLIIGGNNYNYLFLTFHFLISVDKDGNETLDITINQNNYITFKLNNEIDKDYSIYLYDDLGYILRTNGSDGNVEGKKYYSINFASGEIDKNPTDIFVQNGFSTIKYKYNSVLKELSNQYYFPIFKDTTSFIFNYIIIKNSNSSTELTVNISDGDNYIENIKNFNLVDLKNSKDAELSDLSFNNLLNYFEILPIMFSDPYIHFVHNGFETLYYYKNFNLDLLPDDKNNSIEISRIIKIDKVSDNDLLFTTNVPIKRGTSSVYESDIHYIIREIKFNRLDKSIKYSHNTINGNMSNNPGNQDYLFNDGLDIFINSINNNFYLYVFDTLFDRNIPLFYEYNQNGKVSFSFTLINSNNYSEEFIFIKDAFTIKDYGWTSSSVSEGFVSDKYFSYILLNQELVNKVLTDDNIRNLSASITLTSTINDNIVNKKGTEVLSKDETIYTKSSVNINKYSHYSIYDMFFDENGFKSKLDFIKAPISKLDDYYDNEDCEIKLFRNADINYNNNLLKLAGSNFEDKNNIAKIYSLTKDLEKLLSDEKYLYEELFNIDNLKDYISKATQSYYKPINYGEYLTLARGYEELLKLPDGSENDANYRFCEYSFDEDKLVIKITFKDSYIDYIKDYSNTATKNIYIPGDTSEEIKKFVESYGQPLYSTKFNKPHFEYGNKTYIVLGINIELDSSTTEEFQSSNIMDVTLKCVEYNQNSNYEEVNNKIIYISLLSYKYFYFKDNTKLDISDNYTNLYMYLLVSDFQNTSYNDILNFGSLNEYDEKGNRLIANGFYLADKYREKYNKKDNSYLFYLFGENNNFINNNITLSVTLLDKYNKETEYLNYSKEDLSFFIENDNNSLVGIRQITEVIGEPKIDEEKSTITNYLGLKVISEFKNIADTKKFEYNILNDNEDDRKDSYYIRNIFNIQSKLLLNGVDKTSKYKTSEDYQYLVKDSFNKAKFTYDYKYDIIDPLTLKENNKILNNSITVENFVNSSENSYVDVSTFKCDFKSITENGLKYEKITITLPESKNKYFYYFYRNKDDSFTKGISLQENITIDLNDNSYKSIIVIMISKEIDDTNKMSEYYPDNVLDSLEHTIFIIKDIEPSNDSSLIKSASYKETEINTDYVNDGFIKSFYNIDYTNILSKYSKTIINDRIYILDNNSPFPFNRVEIERLNKLEEDPNYKEIKGEFVFDAPSHKAIRQPLTLIEENISNNTSFTKSDISTDLIFAGSTKPQINTIYIVYENISGTLESKQIPINDGYFILNTINDNLIKIRGIAFIVNNINALDNKWKYLYCVINGKKFDEKNYIKIYNSHEEFKLIDFKDQKEDISDYFIGFNQGHLFFNNMIDYTTSGNSFSFTGFHPMLFRTGLFADSSYNKNKNENTHIQEYQGRLDSVKVIIYLTDRCFNLDHLYIDYVDVYIDGVKYKIPYSDFKNGKYEIEFEYDFDANRVKYKNLINKEEVFTTSNDFIIKTITYINDETKNSFNQSNINANGRFEDLFCTSELKIQCLGNTEEYHEGFDDETIDILDKPIEEIIGMKPQENLFTYLPVFNKFKFLKYDVKLNGLPYNFENLQPIVNYFNLANYKNKIYIKVTDKRNEQKFLEYSKEFKLDNTLPAQPTFMINNLEGKEPTKSLEDGVILNITDKSTFIFNAGTNCNIIKSVITPVYNVSGKFYKNDMVNSNDNIISYPIDIINEKELPLKEVFEKNDLNINGSYIITVFYKNIDTETKLTNHMMNYCSYYFTVNDYETTEDFHTKEVSTRYKLVLYSMENNIFDYQNELVMNHYNGDIGITYQGNADDLFKIKIKNITSDLIKQTMVPNNAFNNLYREVIICEERLSAIEFLIHNPNNSEINGLEESIEIFKKIYIDEDIYSFKEDVSDIQTRFNNYKNTLEAMNEKVEEFNNSFISFYNDHYNFYNEFKYDENDINNIIKERVTNLNKGFDNFLDDITLSHINMCNGNAVLQALSYYETKVNFVKFKNRENNYYENLKITLANFNAKE